jgi:chaperonin cofactor prefoldin
LVNEDNKQKILHEEYTKLSTKIETLQTELKTVETQRQQVNANIDKITSWGDIDNYFK